MMDGGHVGKQEMASQAGIEPLSGQKSIVVGWNPRKTEWLLCAATA